MVAFKYRSNTIPHSHLNMRSFSFKSDLITSQHEQVLDDGYHLSASKNSIPYFYIYIEFDV